jgi:para-aminobenzoate synthetase component 1
MPNKYDSTNNNGTNSSVTTSLRCLAINYSRATVIKLFSLLCGLSNSSKSSLLISATQDKDTDPSNRFSFFCTNPSQSKVFHSQKEIRAWQAELKTDINTNAKSEIPFHSGWMGYYSYPSAADNSKSIIAEFNYYPWCICFDHLNSTLHLLGNITKEATGLFALLLGEEARSKNTATDFSCSSFTPAWSKQDYREGFNKVQDYLKAGDCYQINLTHPHQSSFQGQASSLLPPLFEQMQPNFGGYFQGQGVELISLSPERFISINAGGRLEAKPIKGTIKRSPDSKTDQLLIEELSNSPKNQAENLMIVDLLRNDLSISALPGSVKVEKLFELESHPNVHHLVSTISAQLKPEIKPSAAISQAFPGGSITGAPKIRAMEIIEELEVQPRSLYCGSLGYYSDSGHCDFNILIRNLEFRDNTITCWGGGGITVDSECDDEYEESITKIRRIMDVVENAGKTSY